MKVLLTPNDFGVYPDDAAERLTLVSNKPGNHRLNAEICLLEVPGKGWLHSVFYTYEEGSGAYGLSETHSGFASSRAEARGWAVSRLSGKNWPDTPQIRRILAWLKTMENPVQPDLFAGAA